jgi:hypothetical protein
LRAAKALMEAKGVGVARALAAKAIAAHRWASPVARPVKEPSVVAARAATRVAVTKAAVARVAGLVAPRAVVARVVVATVVAVFGAFQLEQLAENWALAAWEAVEMAAAAWVAGGTMADWVAGRGGGVSHSRRSRSQSRNSCLTRTSPHPGRLCRQPYRKCRGRSLVARARQRWR